MGIGVRIVALLFTLALLAMTVAVMVKEKPSVLTLLSFVVVSLLLVGTVAAFRSDDSDS